MKRRIAVIFGGQSSEHEVSRVSAESIVRNINSERFDVVLIGITKDGRWLKYDGPIEKMGSGEWQAIAENSAPACMTENAGMRQKAAVFVRGIFEAIGAESEDKRIDVVFPVLHGCNGEDGTIQGLFELAGIPYVGCGVLGSALGMDKAYSKIVFAKEGIPQGEFLVFSRRQIYHAIDKVVREVEALLSYPCFIKPSNAGSSVGVSKVHDRKELTEALRLAARFDRKVLAEEFINGREIECAVLGNDEPSASVVGEVVPGSEFYDYQAKYSSTSSSRVMIPAAVPDETASLIRDYAVRAFKALDCSGLSRADFFVHRETGKVYINEINTLPGFTSISMYPKLWEAAGIPYGELIERLVDLAVERFNDNIREI